MTREPADTIREVFSRYPDIVAVYQFGSSVTGKWRNGSDIDLALVPRDSDARNSKLAMLRDLAESGLDNVDIVFLHTDDIVLKYEAVRLNGLVCSTPDFDRGALYSINVRQYPDFEPYLAVQRQAMKRSLQNGQT